MPAEIAKFGLELDVQRLRRDVDRAKRQLDRMDRQASETRRKVKAAGLAIGASLVAAAAATTLLTKEVFATGAAVVETRSKFEAVFRQNTTSVRQFAKEFGSLAGLSEVNAEAVLATTGSIVQGMGFSARASAGFSQEVVKLSGDLASFNNLPTDDVARRIQSAITGEFESMKALGIVIRVSDVNQRALNISGKESVKLLTQQERATATLAIITERAGQAVGDLARTADSPANQMKRIAAEFANIKDGFAEAVIIPLASLLPVLEKMVPLVDKLAGGFAAMVNAVAGTSPITLSPTQQALVDLQRSASFSQIRQNQVAFVGRRAGNTDELTSLQAAQAAAGPANLMRGGGGVQLRDRNALARRVAELEAENAAIDQAFRIIGERLAEQILQQRESARLAREIAEARAKEQLFTQARAGGVVGPGADFLPGLRLPGVDEINKAAIIAGRETGRLAKTMRRAQGDVKGLGLSAEQAGAQMIIAAGRLLVGAIQGRGGGGGFLGGLIGAVGGIVSAANPLAGAAIGLGGGIVSGLLAPSSDPIPVRIDDYSDNALARLDRRTGPDNVRVVVVTADGTALADVQKRNNLIAQLTGEDVFAGVRVSG